MKSQIFSFLLFVGVASCSILNDPLVVEWLREQNEPIVSQQEDTFVTIRNGTIRGTTIESVNNDTIYAYLGIPYAAPPVGNLRFRPPQEYNGWGPDVIWDGTQQPHACAQFLTNVTIAEEDCLFVSVYSRRAGGNPGSPLPVMFWIHGGGFLLGQTSYYAPKKLLVQDNIIYVSVQYRLGPLGFLSSGDGVIPGNNGMKDVVQALRWVQENIAAFGGDPNRVTVFGESAGAAASIYLMTSPLAQGLFHQVAAMSGTSLAEWSIERNPENTLKKLAQFLECDDSTSETIHACLMEMEWAYISQAHFYVLMEESFGNLKAVLPGASVVIEGDIPGAFLTAEPLELLESGVIPSSVPLLLGATQHEGSLLVGAAYVLSLASSGLLDDPVYVRDHLIGDLLSTWEIDEKRNGASISQGLALAFLPPGNPRTNFSTFTYELIDMISVVFMKAPVLRTADILSRRLPAVYLYSFEYYGEGSLWKVAFALIEELFGNLLPIPDFDGGITHADDTLYMFSMPVNTTEEDNVFSRIFCQLFTNFAEFGEPAPVTTPFYPHWPKYSVEDPKYMKLNRTPTVQTDYTASWRQGIPGISN